MKTRSLTWIAILAISFAAQADPIVLRDDAPDRHVVVKGDTLWAISARFLASPWRWPELWQLNREAIHNPHRIYPGDVILLTWRDGAPRLSKLETVKLTPQVRSEALAAETAIPALPHAAVAPFLAGTLIVEASELARQPRLLHSQDGRSLFGHWDTVYASASDGRTPNWEILRPGPALRDPDSGEVLGYEAHHVGFAEVVAHGAPATLRIVAAKAEVLPGDRLLPRSNEAGRDFQPHAPDRPLTGKLIAAHGGLAMAGPHTSVVLNKGRHDGLAPGSVLAVYRAGRALPERGGKAYASFGDELVDLLTPFDFFQRVYPDGQVAWRYVDRKCLRKSARPEVETATFYDPAVALEECSPDGSPVIYSDVGCIKPGKRIVAGELYDPKAVLDLHCRPQPNMALPDSRMGLVMVYRVYDRVSYALVMEASGPIHLLDLVRNP